MKSLNKMASIAKGLMLAAFLAVGTTVVNAEETTTYKPTAVGKWVKGEEFTGNGQEVYIYNVGAGTFISGKTASITDIASASSWKISDGSNDTHTFACNNSTADRIHVDYEYGQYIGKKWVAEIREKSGASDLKLNKEDEDNTYTITRTANVGPIYKPSNETRYFSINGTSYEAVSEANSNSKWLFISTEQKTSYTTYTSLFNKLSGYLNNEKVAADKNMTASIQSTLTDRSGDNCTYTTYEDDKAALETKIEEVEAFINSTTTGIKFNAVNGKAEVTAIYNANGVRQNNLTKGINIVKMSDGTTKKIIK